MHLALSWQRWREHRWDFELMADRFQCIISILDKSARVMTWRPTVVFTTPKSTTCHVKLYLKLNIEVHEYILSFYRPSGKLSGSSCWLPITTIKSWKVHTTDPFGKNALLTRAFSWQIARNAERIWGLWHHHVVVIAHTTTLHTCHRRDKPALIRVRLMLVR